MKPIAFGVIRLTQAPLRARPADTSEMVTQLLFGEHYQVLEVHQNKKWVKVKNVFDGYEGWLDAKQHHPITQEYFHQINETEYKICTDLVSKILFKQQVNHITFGAILPLLNNPIFKDEENVAFNGSAKSLYQKQDVHHLISQAHKLLNAPYLWGGRTPFGIDCSGFVQLVFRAVGYALPRDASQQILVGKEVTFEDRMPGDLAFFTQKEGKVSHVGLVLENDEIIHASGKVRIDVLKKEGIFQPKQNTYTHPLFKMKRVLKA